MDIGKLTLLFPPTSFYVVIFVLIYFIFYETKYKEKILKFLVILVLHASVLSVMLLLTTWLFQHQAAKEVTLAIYSFLILLQSNHFALPYDHIPQIAYLLKDFFFFFSSNFTENVREITSQLKLLGGEDYSVII